MRDAAMQILRGPGRQAGLSDSWPSLLVTALVAAAATWSFSPRPIPPFPETQVHSNQLLVNGLAKQGQRFLAAGELGRILVGDAGENWHEAKVEPQRGSTFTQVVFTDPKTAYAVGHDGWIVRSEDGGENWKEVHFDADPENQSNPLMGIAGPYDGKLYAFGGFGTLLASADGKAWNAVTDETLGDHHLNAMTQAADGTLWVAGERGLLAHSKDGQHWQAVPSVYTGSFYGLLSLPSKNLLAYGMRGNVFYSSDLGASWHKSAVPDPFALFGGTVDADGNVILVGEAEVILRSSDGGVHFTELAQGERKRLAAVVPLAKDRLMVAGESGVAIATLGVTLGAKAAAQQEHKQ